MRKRKVAVWLAAAGLVATACGSETNAPEQTTGAQPHVSIVASTSVWGSVAKAVAGDHGEVKSIISSPVDDPHSFEASPADAGAIADAQLVVFNGGDYDHWVEEVLADHADAKRVDAFTVGGHQPGSNPHVFYDMPTVSAVARTIADQLASVDSAHGDEFRANADKFVAQIDEIVGAEKAIAAAHTGAPIVATEDVAYYMQTASGLADRTPEGYYRAVDADADPAPVDIAAVLDLINSRGVRVVLFNPQTVTSATQRIVDAAKAANVPIVNVTETLPDNTDFIDWQRGNVDQLGSALNPR